jgi:ABC-type bacteriocin/lantibiotic exporter with double-glycine peptidase domain
MLVSALLEIVSLGAVLPFLGILVAPEHVFNNSMIKDVAQKLGLTTADQLLLPLTVAFSAAAIIAGGIRVLLLWASTRLAFSTGADLGIEVYTRTLYQPYRVHVARNSSQVISGITGKVNEVVFLVVLPFLTLISSTILLVAILTALVVFDPMTASVAAVGFGVSYALISSISRRHLLKNSRRIAAEQTQVVKALQEGLGGIRDVLLDGTQRFYGSIYRQADHHLRRAQGNNIFLGQSPRYIMEAFGMTLIAALAYALNLQGGSIGKALPMLGALALGAQRLLPALQQIYSSWASINGGYSSLTDTLKLLDQQLPADLLQPVSEPIRFENFIRFENVRFRYTEKGPWVLDGLDLTIPKGARVGIVGTTGSGKSTTLDILMGLLTPTEGIVSIDSKPLISNNVNAWQRCIAHVPQNIYLSDATLAENIAFSIEPGAIDMDRVRNAARQAQIADFIERAPDGYQAQVGERGIRLSGGQRQRIGIARALYKQASVLVFDEATSALDTATEQSVMQSIDELSSELTIILIAHRISTIRNCEIIVELQQGRVAAQGSYEDLIQNSASFRLIASGI